MGHASSLSVGQRATEINCDPHRLWQYTGCPRNPLTRGFDFGLHVYRLSGISSRHDGSRSGVGFCHSLQPILAPNLVKVICFFVVAEPQTPSQVIASRLRISSQPVVMSATGSLNSDAGRQEIRPNLPWHTLD